MDLTEWYTVHQSLSRCFIIDHINEPSPDSLVSQKTSSNSDIGGKIPSHGFLRANAAPSEYQLINLQIAFALLQKRTGFHLIPFNPSGLFFILIQMRCYVQTDLLPQVWFKSQTGTSCNEPAVSHVTLIQVMRTDAFDEKVRVLGYLLKKKDRDVALEV